MTQDQDTDAELEETRDVAAELPSARRVHPRQRVQPPAQRARGGAAGQRQVILRGREQIRKMSTILKLSLLSH